MDLFVGTLLMTMVPALVRFPQMEVSNGITLTSNIQIDNEVFNNFDKMTKIPPFIFRHEDTGEKFSVKFHKLEKYLLRKDYGKALSTMLFSNFFFQFF